MLFGNFFKASCSKASTLSSENLGIGLMSVLSQISSSFCYSNHTCMLLIKFFLRVSERKTLFLCFGPAGDCGTGGLADEKFIPEKQLFLENCFDRNPSFCDQNSQTFEVIRGPSVTKKYRQQIQQENWPLLRSLPVCASLLLLGGAGK